MDDTARIPSRIVLNGSSSISLSDRFRQIKQQPRINRNNRMSLREPRSFLYDDYMDEDRGYGGRSDYGISSRGRSSRGLDIDLDEYASRNRRPTDGLLRRREEILDDFVGSDGQARRFANAMGIQSSRSQQSYDDLDYGAPMPRGRLHQMSYRENPRRPVIRRVVEDRGYIEPAPRTQVVQIVERVRRPAPQRRIQVVKRVPIHQRVVKKIVVQKRGGGPGNRRSFGGSGLKGRIQKRAPAGRRNSGASPAQKRQQRGGGPKKQGGGKPKISASDLDRELDEYMKGSKHPRIES